jgi:hypothetical protein
MADDTNLSIKFGADTSDLQAGMEQASDLMAGLGDQVSTLSDTTQQQFEATVAQILAAAKANTDALVALANSSSKQVAQTHTNAADVTQKAWTQSVGSVVRTFGDGLLGMARGSESFGQVVKKTAASAESAFAHSIESQVTKFIAGEASKVASAVTGQNAQSAATITGQAERASAEQAGHDQSLLLNLEATLKTVTNNAVAAASAAFQFFASMGPLGLPLGAAAAAATFTAVEAFGALASASGGYDIGAENPLTQLHAREMVLPASIAEPLRGMIAANSGGGGAAAAGAGGATYNTAVYGLDSRSIRRMMNTPANVRAAAGAFARYG